MKTLPLTVLVHDGPIARAYLAAMRTAGCRPQRIVLMVRPAGRFLPRRWRLRFAQAMQSMSSLHWCRWLHARHHGLFEVMARRAGEAFGLAEEVFEAIPGRVALSEYAESTDRVMVTNLRDAELEAALSRSGRDPVLFTGGGFVPESLLGLDGLRFLHVHPGVLPEVRGADALLWSMLIRGRPGASCFYMAKGIDTGDVILRREYPPLTFPREAAGQLDDLMLYRAVYSFYDPVVRASLLLAVLEQDGDLSRLRSAPQNGSEGVTYHFMHPEVRKVALERIFVQ